nr:MAG TPA: tail tape measure protein [Caudoviricetes sp.]
MADVDITSLSVEISAESQGAELNIDKLATAISNLRTKGNVAKVCSSLDKLSASISALKSASTGLDGLSKITSFMNGLANVDLTQSAKGIRSVANALNKISSVNLANTDFSGLGSKMNSLKNGLSPISSISDSSIKSLRSVSSAINSIAKIPSITKKLDSKTLDDFAEVCKKVASAISPLASKLDKVGRSFSSLPSKIKSAVNSTTNFSSANQKASASLSSLENQLETIKKRAAQLVSLKAIATYLANAVTKFNDFYEATDLFNNAMGELSGQATELINKMESLLGIDPTEAMTNIATIQSLATSFGLASDKAYILSKNLTQLAYDESSYWNKDTATTFTAIASAISGELEPIRRLGVDLSQARLQQELLALGFNKQVSSLSQADKAVLRYIAIMKQTANVQGNLAQTISSPANMVRILKSEISQLAKAVGQLLYPAFKAILPVLIAAVDLIKEFVVSLASVFGQKIEFTDFSKTQKDIGGVANAMDDTADATKSAAKAAKDYTIGFDELNIIDPSQNSGSSGSGGGATGNLLGDVDLSQYDMFKDYAGSAVDEIKAKLKSLDSFQIGTQIGEQLNKLMGMIYDAIHSVDWASLGAVFADGINGLVDSVDWDLFGRLLADRFIIEFELLGGFLSRLDWTSVLNAFIDGFSGFFHELSDWIATVDWTGVGKQLTDKLSDAFQNVEIEKLARVLFNFITDSINAVADFLAGTDSYQLGQDLVDFAIRAVTSVDWAGLAQAIGRFFGEAFIEALDFMGGLVSRIADYFEKKVAEGPFDNVGLNIVYGIYYGIQDAITNVASWIVENVFNPFINGFKSAFGINSPSTVMAEQGGYIIAGLKKGITDAISSVTETAKKILSAIKSAFKNFSLFDIGKNLIQGLIDGVNNMIETAKNAVANVGNAVIDKVKNVLGIHSPSTVFAEIGGYIDQGLANGITAAVSYVTTAMQGVVDAVREKGQALIDAGSTQATNYVTGFLNGLDTQWQRIDQSLQSDFFGSIGTLWDAISNGDLEKLGTWAASYFYHAMDDEQRKQIKSIANNSLQWLTQGLSSVWNNIAGMASSFIGQLVPSTVAATTAQTGLNVAMNANPILFVISLIGMLAGALFNLAGTNSDVAGGISSVWGGLKNFMSYIFEGIVRLLGLFIQGFVNGVNVMIGAYNLVAQLWGGQIEYVKNPLFEYADKIAASRESGPAVDSIASGNVDYSNVPGTSQYSGANSSGSYTSSYSRSAELTPSELRDSVKEGFIAAMQESGFGGTDNGNLTVRVYLDGKEITSAVEKRQSDRGMSLMGTEAYSY